jgi:hypothetical protein
LRLEVRGWRLEVGGRKDRSERPDAEKRIKQKEEKGRKIKKKIVIKSLQDTPIVSVSLQSTL